MHPYATDSDERKKVPLYLGVTATIGAWVLPKLLLWMHLTVPWWFEAPSVMGMYMALHGAFDAWLWRWGGRRLGCIRVPDLNGEWLFEVRSSFQPTVPVSARVTIHQNWRGMSIRLKTDQSSSASVIAALLTNDPNEFVLSYEFVNTPRQGAPATMHVHRGSAEIRFPKGNVTTIEGTGEYYSGRDRQNQGTLEVSRC